MVRSAGVVRVIKSLQNPTTLWLFQNGGCYQFAMFLRTLYPETTLWYDAHEGHMYARIGKYWYDIRGIHYLQGDKQPYDYRNGHPAYRWCASGGQPKPVFPTAYQLEKFGMVPDGYQLVKAKG